MLLMTPGAQSFKPVFSYGHRHDVLILEPAVEPGMSRLFIHRGYLLNRFFIQREPYIRIFLPALITFDLTTYIYIAARSALFAKSTVINLLTATRAMLICNLCNIS